MKKEILSFWQLCELSDFETFSLYKEKINSLNFSKLDFIKNIKTEYIVKNGKEYNIYINNKTTHIYKIYIGLIKSEDIIKYIYQIFKENNLLNKDVEQYIIDDIQKLKSNEHTYMAYCYLNANLNLISINGNALIINPIFYIIYSILNKNKINNSNYNDFLERYNQNLVELYQIENNAKIVLIPEINNLIKLGKYPNPLQYIKPADNHEIIIFSETLKQLEQTNTKEAQNILNAIENDESINIISKELNCDSYDEYLLINSIELAKSRPYDFIYLQTKEKLSFSINIPINLYLIKSIQKENFTLPSIIASQQSINENDLNKIFFNLKEDFKIFDEFFYKQNSLYLFIQEFLNLKLQNIEQKVQSPLVSFYIDALNEEPSKLTIPYINGIINQIDVNSNINIRKSINSIDKFENVNSRWVSQYPLNYAQQASINLFLSKLNKGNNIFSVNGPPGSGKTTLLKDVISNVITKKIKTAITLNKKIFDDNGNFNLKLCNQYEILVTSNNNGAVENITLELPKLEEFNFNYINAYKEDFLLSKYATKFYNFNSWSFISARLGNKSNVNDFMSNLESVVKEIKEDKQFNEDFILNRYDTLVVDFQNIILSLKEDEKLFKSFDNIEKLSKEVENLKIKLKASENELNELKEELLELNKKIEEIEEQIINNKKQIDIIKERKELKTNKLDTFWFLTKIFKFKEYKNLLKDVEQINNELEEYLKNLQSFEKQKNDIFDKTSYLKKEYQSKENGYIDNKNKLNILLKDYKKLHSLYQKRKYHINNNDFYNQEEKVLQKCSLYAKDGYLKNKAKLFKISMQINELLFLMNIDNFMNSIKYYLENYSKKNLNTKEKEKLQNAFSALFFLFPVVSTTLASSYNMLQHIKEYGILLCDESGQATPQSLVGVLNRSNNALIVGDPLQVEPVFTAPNILIKLLEQIYNISNIHSPLSSSAQQLADNANVYGSFYKVDNKKVWVGMPLVVHRRCIDPMFSISNIISYNNKMVLATNALKEYDPIHNLPESAWIDVISHEGDFNENSSMKEKEVLKIFIKKYKHILNDNYFIISPFKSIYKIFEINENIGTVHTFQGKEADVVFFILGGKTNGAKAWASSKANILNVAVTRAKKRIYIIGDYNKWKNHKYFNEAIKLLPLISNKT